MVRYTLIFSKQAQKDSKKLASSNLKGKAETLLCLLEIDPFCQYPTFEKLIDDLEGYYSRRINIQHRIVYEVDEKEKTVRIIRLWTHYE